VDTRNCRCSKSTKSQSVWKNFLFLRVGGSVTSYTLSCYNIRYTFVFTYTKYNIIVKIITTIGTIEKSVKLRCIKSTRHFKFKILDFIFIFKWRNIIVLNLITKAYTIT